MKLTISSTENKNGKVKVVATNDVTAEVYTFEFLETIYSEKLLKEKLNILNKIGAAPSGIKPSPAEDLVNKKYDSETGEFT